MPHVFQLSHGEYRQERGGVPRLGAVQLGHCGTSTILYQAQFQGRQLGMQLICRVIEQVQELGIAELFSPHLKGLQWQRGLMRHWGFSGILRIVFLLFTTPDVTS